MRALALGSVDNLKQHGVGDVKLRELVEGRCGQEEFTAVVCLFALGSRHHGDRIASVVLIEAARPRARTLLHRALVHVGVVL